MPENKMEAIKVENLTKEFEIKKGKLKAVDNLSFSIKEGSIAGFVGPNGAGKSTTIKIILDLIRPTSGNITILGQDYHSSEIKKLIGYMPEKDAFYEDMFPLDYLTYLGAISGMSKKDASERAGYLLDLIGLKGAINQRVGSFSSGMKKKLLFAQSIIHNPKILILDEPTANLDPLAQAQMMNILADLQKKGITIFISSHNIEELEKLVDFLVVIDHGKLVVEADVEEVKRKASPGVEIKVDNTHATCDILNKSGYKTNIIGRNHLIVLGHFTTKETNKIIKSLANAGIQISSFNQKSRSLWEVIISMLKNE